MTMKSLTFVTSTVSAELNWCYGCAALRTEVFVFANVNDLDAVRILKESAVETTSPV